MQRQQGANAGLWPVAPEHIVLAGPEVHVWGVRLDLSLPQLEHMRRLLAPEETARAARFVRTQDRVRFIAARGRLRMVLGCYLGLPPAAISIGYNAHGKPFVEDGAELQFNLSHSADQALIAVTRRGRVGIDLERLQSDLDTDGIVAQFFAPIEIRTYLALPAHERPAAFLRGWTRKEAYLKATGAGMSIPLNQFAVTLAPGEPPRLIAHDADPTEVERWSLVDCDPGAPFMAALALEQPACRVRYWRWPEASA